MHLHILAEGEPAASEISIQERAMRALPGLPLLVLGLAAIGGAIAIGVVRHGGTRPWPAGLLVVAGLILLGGLTSVAPGQARVVLLFGKYLGTIRATGLRWVIPLARRPTISTRIRNQESTTAKVNDLAGIPIEIAAVVVWQVRDTARALFAVDDFAAFVTIQAETAVRHIAARFPYDAHETDDLCLRNNTDEITSLLACEIAERVAPAGVAVIEARITRLAYAPEIAQVMLQRQQAAAVVAARQRIVEGAVGMVELALERLENEALVELDEERKAAMVSNLLVVLCGERGTLPVVNVGSLYH